MAKIKTIVIEEDILKKLRMIQARMIQDNTEHVSFSKVINLELKRALKKSN